MIDQKEIRNKFLYMFKLEKNIDGIYPISFGFECDQGWYKLIDKALIEISERDKNDHIYLFQVKEKFGSLRIYFEIDQQNKDESLWDDVYNITNKYEKL